jgi:hypothetical protein
MIQDKILELPHDYAAASHALTSANIWNPSGITEADSMEN